MGDVWLLQLYHKRDKTLRATRTRYTFVLRSPRVAWYEFLFVNTNANVHTHWGNDKILKPKPALSCIEHMQHATGRSC